MIARTLFKPLHIATLASAFAFIIAFGAPVPAAAKVLASVAPLHSLVASVMKGVDTPELLIPADADPHSYALKPSDIKKIQDSEVIFVISPYLETSMMKAILRKDEKATFLIDIEGMNVYPLRKATNWDEAIKNKQDPHIWLDINNAKKMVQKIAIVLAEKDWKNADTYIKNGNTTIAKLENLRKEEARQLARVKQVPFFVGHDAWQYYEKQNKLMGIAGVMVDEDIAPSAKYREALKGMAEADGIKCLFVEPWNTTEDMKALAAELDMNIVPLDPIGAKIALGANHYFTLMQNMTTVIKACLTNSAKDAAAAKAARTKASNSTTNGSIVD